MGQCCYSPGGTACSGWTLYGHCALSWILYPSPAIFTLITQKCTVRLGLWNVCLPSFCPETCTGRYVCTGAVEDVTSRCWVHLTLEKEGYTFLRKVWTCKLFCTAWNFRRLELWPMALPKRQLIRVLFVRRADYCCWLGKLMKYFVVSKLVDNAKKRAVSILLKLILHQSKLGLRLYDFI